MASFIGFKQKIILVILISLFSVKAYSQRDIKIFDFLSNPEGYYIKTNRNTITYSLISNPNKFYREKLVSFDSLGIIFDNESFQPIPYSQFASFSFKPNNMPLRQAFAVSLFGLIAVNSYIYISNDTYIKYLMPVSVFLWGAGVGLVSITNAATTHKVTFYNLNFSQFKAVK